MEEIRGFEKEYAITHAGEVWSHKSQKRLTLRGSGISGKIKRRKRDYKTVALWKRGFGYKYFYVHRLVAEHFLPNPGNLPFVNHKDGNKANNNVENLEWCTHKENTEHARLNGLTTRGDRNTQTKLTEEQVRQIRTVYGDGGVSQEELGRRFGVSQATVHLIIARKNWAYL